jgi:hypothetical protein
MANSSVRVRALSETLLMPRTSSDSGRPSRPVADLCPVLPTKPESSFPRRADLHVRLHDDGATAGLQMVIGRPYSFCVRNSVAMFMTSVSADYFLPTYSTREAAIPFQAAGPEGSAAGSLSASRPCVQNLRS